MNSGVLARGKPLLCSLVLQWKYLLQQSKRAVGAVGVVLYFTQCRYLTKIIDDVCSWNTELTLTDKDEKIHHNQLLYRHVIN